MENLNRVNRKENTFSDFVILLVKWRRLILWNVIIVTVIAAIISLMIDKWYTSTASIIPPKSKGGLLGDISNFSSTIKDLSKTLGRLGATSEEAYDYLAILQSRTSFEKVINKFDLRKVYKIDSNDPIEDVFNELDSNVDFNVEDEGNITIKVTDKSQERAAEIANYFVEVLNEISIELGTFEAKNNREFIEKRYFQVLRDLKSAEDTLQNFSEKYSVYSMADQTKAAITAAAEMKAKIEIQDIELELLKKNYGSDNPVVLDKQALIKEMQKKLQSMKYSDNNIKGSELNLYTPFSKLPEVGIEYLRYKREFELQTKLLEFMLPIYEQAKIEEKKDIPVCVILDVAKPAQEKSGPKKAIIVSAAFLISFFLSIICVLIMNSLGRLREDEIKYRKINEGIFLPLKRMFFLK